jgi:type I restriction enzyme S subunit
MALKRLVKIIAGQSPPSDAVADFEGEGLPFLQGNAEFNAENPTPIHRCDSASKQCNAGDILISVRAPVGALNIADRQYGIGRGLCAVRPSKINQRFLWWLSHTSVTRLQCLAVGSTYDAVAAEDIGSLPVTVPSLEAQQAIACYLDAETSDTSALIGKKQSMIELLDGRFESVVFHAVTRGCSDTRPLKASGLPWIEEIPAEWSTPTVSTHFELQLGKMLNKKATNGPDQYPYLRNANVQWDRFDLDDLASMHFDKADRRRYELRPGDLLVCEGGEVGRAAVWQGEVTECYFQKAIHRIRPRGTANSRYLMYCLRAAARHSVFAADGNLSTIAHLTNEQLRAYRFPWPPWDEQATIVEHLDVNARRTAKAKNLLSRQIDLLLEHRQTLITAAVTGELGIPGISE